MSQTPNASATQDDVLVYDGFSQVFRNARPLTADVKRESKLMEHPIESGSMVTDHAVKQAVEIELPCSINAEFYRDTSLLSG